MRRGLWTLRLGTAIMLRRGFQPSRLWSSQWCRDVGFNPRVLVLHWWRWLALRLEFGFYFLMTCLQWFLDSLQGADVIDSLPHPGNGIRISKFGLRSSGMRTPIWATSYMGHWKKIIKIIKITGDTDYYYCMIKLSCLPLIYYIMLLYLVPMFLILDYTCPTHVYNNNIRNVCYLITPSFGSWYQVSWFLWVLLG